MSFNTCSINSQENPFIRDVEAVIGPSKTVMVYGYSGAWYTLVQKQLSAQGYEVLDYVMGCGPDKTVGTEEIEHLREGSTNKKICKNAITKIVLENVKRDAAGVPIIPLLFCAKYQGILNFTPQFDPSPKRSLTDSEINRIYKLIHFEDEKVREVTEKTIHFVCTERNSPNSFDLTGLKECSPPWEDKWKVKEPKNKSTGWREEFRNALKAFRAKNLPPSLDNNKLDG